MIEPGSIDLTWPNCHVSLARIHVRKLLHHLTSTLGLESRLPRISAPTQPQQLLLNFFFMSAISRLILTSFCFQHQLSFISVTKQMPNRMNKVLLLLLIPEWTASSHLFSCSHFFKTNVSLRTSPDSHDTHKTIYSFAKTVRLLEFEGTFQDHVSLAQLSLLPKQELKTVQVIY